MRAGSIFNPDEDITGSAQARREQTYAAITYTLQHPLVGAGIGLCALALSDVGGTWHVVHNVWLEYSTDLGLPGLVMFALLFLSAVRTARAARRAAAGRPEHTAVAAYAEGLELSLIGFCVSTPTPDFRGSDKGRRPCGPDCATIWRRFRLT